MILIPADVQMKVSLQQGSIYYFADGAIQSAEPHYWVVLNATPKEDNSLVLAVASSKVQRTQEIVGRLGFPPETVVVVTPGECKCFEVDSVFNCNSVFLKTAGELTAKLKAGQLRIRVEQMPQEILTRLVAGVLASPRTSGAIKQVFSDSITN